MGVQERMARLWVLLDLPKYTVLPGELPWQDIQNPVERTKAYSRQRVRMWRKLHPGRSAEVMRKYCEEHPGYTVERTRKYREGHPGYNAEVDQRYRERHPRRFAEAVNKYQQSEKGRAHLAEYNSTPKGKAKLARSCARRRERSTDPELYAARVELLHVLRESCTKCHTPYKIVHQIDHIIPLCLGGSDDWNNLQPLCVLCHREKTKEDMKIYRDYLMTRKSPRHQEANQNFLVETGKRNMG